MPSRTLPIVQSIPHGGLQAPELLRELLALDETALYNECDLWVDQIYDFSAGDAPTLASVTTPIARGIIDVNRPPHDLGDPDGPIKAQSSYGVPTWRRPLEPHEKALLLEAHWAPYHAQMEQVLAQHAGSVRLFLDGHSMAQTGPTTYAFAGEPRPLVCLANLGDRDGERLAGGEPTSCPGALLREAGRLAERHFADLALLEPEGDAPPTVALNWPFPGGYLSRRYTAGCIDAGETAHPAPLGIMIEVNRGLYVGNQRADTPPAPPNQERILELRRRLHAWSQELTLLLGADA
jgi:N-formylglutamate amidohydrolase